VRSGEKTFLYNVVRIGDKANLRNMDAIMYRALVGCERVVFVVNLYIVELITETI
jgi:hypothetical protein